MALVALSPLRFAVVAALPGSAAQGDSVVLASSGHLYTFDGSAWVDNGAAAGGGASGLTQLDFGTGAVHATVDVTGQTGILSTSRLFASIRVAASADHSADEHVVEELRVSAGAIVAGDKFTIHGVANAPIRGLWNVVWRWE